MTELDVAHNLAVYEAARTALAEVTRVDEAMPIRNKAEALEVYAKRAKDRELIDYATELRLRAEIRVGELLAEMAARGERDQGKGGDRKSRSRATTVKLQDLGISKSQSSSWQRLAALPEEEQLLKIMAAKAHASRAVDDAPPKRRRRRHAEPVPVVDPEPEPQQVDPIALCVDDVRERVGEAMDAVPAEELPRLFAALRAALRTLEMGDADEGKGEDDDRQFTRH